MLQPFGCCTFDFLAFFSLFAAALIDVSLLELLQFRFRKKIADIRFSYDHYDCKNKAEQKHDAAIVAGTISFFRAYSLDFDDFRESDIF